MGKSARRKSSVQAFSEILTVSDSSRFNLYAPTLFVVNWQILPAIPLTAKSYGIPLEYSPEVLVV